MLSYRSVVDKSGGRDVLELPTGQVNQNSGYSYNVTYPQCRQKIGNRDRCDPEPNDDPFIGRFPRAIESLPIFIAAFDDFNAPDHTDDDQ